MKQPVLMSSVVLCAALSLCGCSTNWQNTMQLNPHPKYFLTIKGHIAEQLRNKIQLRFIQSTVGWSDRCTQVTNHFEGISGNPLKNDPYLAKLDASGNYVIKIPLDKYLPGYCAWRPWGMGITLTEQEYQHVPNGFAFINYSNTKPNKNSSRVFNYICPKKVSSAAGDDCKISLLPGKDILNYVRTNCSTTQVVNVYYKGNKHE